MNDNRLAVLTGPRGIGKTRLLMTLVDELEIRGMKVEGVLSPEIINGGRSMGKELYDISTRKKKILATINQKAYDGVQDLKYCFDLRTLEWGNGLFASIDPLHLLIIDEIGPLELVKRTGLLSAVKAITDRNYKKALVVVRQELIELILASWQVARIFSVIHANEIDQVTKDIYEWILLP